MQNHRKPEAAAIMIRKAHPQDAAAIAACLASAFAPFRSQYSAGAFADTVLNVEGVLSRMAHMSLYVAITSGGEIVATVACAVVDQVGHLRGMAVDGPNGRDTRLPNDFLRAAEDDMRNTRCRRITLDTTLPLQRAYSASMKKWLRPLRQNLRLLRHASP